MKTAIIICLSLAALAAAKDCSLGPCEDGAPKSTFGNLVYCCAPGERISAGHVSTNSGSRFQCSCSTQGSSGAGSGQTQVKVGGSADMDLVCRRMPQIKRCKRLGY